MVFCVHEGIGDPKRLQCFARDTGNEFAADAVARVSARLVERDIHAVFSQGNGKRKTGEAASVDGDRFAQTRDANTRIAPRQSVISRK